jgi:hypothetical protein
VFLDDADEFDRWVGIPLYRNGVNAGFVVPYSNLIVRVQHRLEKELIN